MMPQQIQRPSSLGFVTNATQDVPVFIDEQTQVHDLIRNHHEHLHRRLDDFLASEEQLTIKLLELASREGPTWLQTQEELAMIINKGEARSAAITQQRVSAQPSVVIPVSAAQSTEADVWQRHITPGDTIFAQKEFQENDWKQKTENNTFEKRENKIMTEIAHNASKHKKYAHPQPEEGTLQDKAVQLVCSNVFDACFLFVIVLNSLVMGWEVQLDATGEHMEVKGILNDIQKICSILFIVELAVRLFADRWFFFYSSLWAWNWFDFILVASSTFEIALELVRTWIGPDMGGMKTLATARILRILRITRIARSVRFVRALRVLLLSILSTLKTLVFALVLVLLVIYFYAVILAQAASAHVRDVAVEDIHPELKYFWGSLFKAMLTLFYCISGGVDWNVAFDPLLSVHAVYGLVLITYVIVMFFAVLNAITGAFCTAATDSQMHDNELQLHDLLAAKQVEIRQLAKLFEKVFATLDSDGSGEVDIDEFCEKVQNETVQELFQTLELQPEDAWAFFRLLDKDESGNLDVDEFVSACMQLKGAARSIDLAKSVHDQKMMRKQNIVFMQHVTEQLRKIRIEIAPQKVVLEAPIHPEAIGA